MKQHKSLLIAFGLGAFLLALSGQAQEHPLQAQDDLAQRVEALETELAAARAESAGLSQELAASAQTLDALVEWVGAQAKQADALTATLQSAEEQGFTAGINYQSRETLLAGWRKALAETSKGLPKEEPKSKADAPR